MEANNGFPSHATPEEVNEMFESLVGGSLFVLFWLVLLVIAQVMVDNGMAL